MLLIGTARPQRVRRADLQAALTAHPVARQDLRELGFVDGYSLLAMYLMPKAALLKMAGDAEYNLDNFPRLEFLAPRNLGRETTTLNARLTRTAVPPVVEDADPDRDPDGRLALALAHGYRAVRDRARAREWVDRALQKSPMDAGAHLLRARLAAEDSQYHAAAEDLLRAVGGPVRLSEEAIEVAKTLEAGEAVRVLRKIRQQDPRLVEAQLALARCTRGGHDRQAEAEYLDLARTLPKDARVPFGLGRALLGLGDHSAALEAFDAAATMGEVSGEFQARRGETLIRLRRYPEAVAAYRQALRSNVENITWRLNLGISLAASGPDGRAEAERRFREVLAMDAANTRAWEELHSLGARF
jgi:tetratricopeptide (TPR) repeat protein